MDEDTDKVEALGEHQSLPDDQFKAIGTRITAELLDGGSVEGTVADWTHALGEEDTLWLVVEDDAGERFDVHSEEVTRIISTPND